MSCNAVKPLWVQSCNAFMAFVFLLASSTLGLSLSSLIETSQAYAQDSGQNQPAAEFVVSNFIIDGPNPLKEAETKSILAPYLNRPLDLAQLQVAASELQQEMVGQGYSFFRTSLPAQILNSGEVRLAVEKIDIGAINVLGNQFFSSENIRKSIPVIKVGESPNTQSIASALLLAEENPSKDLRILFVRGAKPRTIDANITVRDQNPNSISVWANNAGSGETSQSRLGIQYQNRNLWGRDHQASLSFTTSPEDPDELSQYGLNYRIPFYSVGGVANFFYSRSDADTGRVADVFDVSGAGESYGIGYTHILKKFGNYQHRLSVNLSDKLFDSDVLFNNQNIGTDVRSRPIGVDYTVRYDQTNWAINSVLSYSTNLSGGSFNDDESYNLSRLGAEQDWSKINLSFRFDQRWSEKWSGSATLAAQFTSDSLISGEKFGFGGAFGSVGPRGFNERELSVDEGYKISLEAGRSFNNQKIRIKAFVDYADGEQNSVQVGEFEDDVLSSVGVGVEWRIRNNLRFTADYGYILNGIRRIDGLDSTSSDDGDDRLHVSLRYTPKLPIFSGLGR